MNIKEYMDLCEHSNDLIQSVTPDGHFRYVNQAWLNTLGYKQNEIAELTIFDIIHHDEIEHCKELFMKVMSSEDVGLVTTTFTTRSGRAIFVEGNVNCHFVNGKPAYTRAIFRDITKLKQSERTISQLYNREKKLRESLEAEISKRSEFARVLVHELKTPLTSILASAELLLESEQKAPYDRVTKGIYRSSSDLNERIGELLELTRAEVGELRIKPRRINPSIMIANIISDIETIVSNNKLHLRTQVPSILPHVKADRKRIRQVMQNLVDNAVKATPVGGEIMIRVMENNDSLMIQVQDTGRGIKRKDQARIFEPYYRVPGIAERYAGLGLGLTLSKRIVELHGGRIWVESEVGSKGSTFSFSIPLSTDIAQ
ncbi:ATP-binding protein [Chloroflexota bacterium]